MTNPICKGPLHLELEGWPTEKPLHFHLRDSQRRLVRQLTLSAGHTPNDYEVEVADLPSGLYFYELYGQQLLASGKVVIVSY